MAPNWPDEVDVFTVPHTRMKKLVHGYVNMISSVDFRDEYHMKILLQDLMNVFMEFKAHEQIENIFIMKKLRSKLRAASVTSAAVCNCHSDNRLTDILELVSDGYRWAQSTEGERQSYGLKLQDALLSFTENFIPHMEEEEEVFQPMLIQYFSYEELKELKAKVIYQHHISNLKEHFNHEKFMEDESEESSDESTELTCYVDNLPNEIFQKIFTHLGPKDLGKAGQVSHRWLQLTRDPVLWPALYPVHWAQGNWTFYPESIGGFDGCGVKGNQLRGEDDQESYYCMDEDADVDESRYIDDTDNSQDFQSGGKFSEDPRISVVALASGFDPQHRWDRAGGGRICTICERLLGRRSLPILQEAKMITGIMKYLLPQVGTGVKVCDLAYSKGISSSLVHKILKLCPNLEVLDLTHTNVGDAAFDEYCVGGRKSKLRHLDLTGCTKITDMTLFSLAAAGEGFHEDCKDEDKDCDDEDTVEVEIENVPPSCTNKLSNCCGQKLVGKINSGTEDDIPPYIANSGGCSGDVSSSGEEEEHLHTHLPSGDHCENLEQEMMSNHAIAEELPLPWRNVEESAVISRAESDFLRLSLAGDAERCQPHEPTSASVLAEHPCHMTQPSQETPSGLVKQLPSTGQPTSCENLEYCTPAVLAQQMCSKPNGAVSRRNDINDPIPSAPRTEKPLLDPPDTSDSILACCKGKCRNCCEMPVKAQLSRNNHAQRGDGTSEDSVDHVSYLEFLSLNGCYQVSDGGLSALSQGWGAPYLKHLDLSGCVGVNGSALAQLVSTCEKLDHSNLYYCDNMVDDPYPTTASGCRNLQCDTLYCCSLKE